MFKKILTVLLLTGVGFANDAIDFKSYKDDCNRGSAEGCYNLGVMYLEGRGTKQDSFKAVELNIKACDAGFGLACNNLGASYFYGEGVKQSNKLALKYFGKACDLKNELGCRNYARQNQK